jgi:hypothetical protein
MTIRLLATYDGFPPQSIITLDAGLEATLIAAGNASATLTGGTVAYRYRAAVDIQPATKLRGSVELIANRSTLVPLTEGSVLTITPTAGTTGAHQRYFVADIDDGGEADVSRSIGATVLTVGPFKGDFVIDVKCTTGSLVAEVSDASAALVNAAILAGKLTAAQKNRAIHAPIGGQMTSVAGQASFTWSFTVQSDVPFDAVRPIFFHSDPTPLPGVKVSAAANANWLNDKSGTALTYTQATWAGAATGTLTAGATQRPSVNAPDFIPCSSVTRTDGGTGYIAQIRAYFPTATTLPISLNQVADMTQLAVLSSGMFMSERTTGDFTSTAAGFGGTYPGRTDTPFWGVELLCRGKVVSFIEFGDSITRGQTVTDILNRNFGERACLAQSLAVNGIAFSNGNCGWSSQTTNQFLARAQDVLAVVKPTCAVYAPFSPNDYGATITQALIETERYKLGVFLDLCAANNVVPVIWTGTPAAGNKAWNAASDNLRKAFNADMRTAYAGKVLVFDADAALSDNASPANLVGTYTADQIHWNSAGHAAAGVRFVQDVIAKLQAEL